MKAYRSGPSELRIRSILIVTALPIWSLGSQSGGPALYRTIEGYVKRGVKVTVVGTPTRSGEVGSNRCLRVVSFDAPALKNLMTYRKIGYFARIAWWLWFQWKVLCLAMFRLRGEAFDVVYGYETAATPAAYIISRVRKIPMVARFQGTTFKVDWEKKRFRSLRAWNTVLGLRVPADLIIMTNDGTQGDVVLEELGVPKSKVRFWMNGVDWQSFRVLPAQSEARKQLDISSQYVLLTVSRLVSWKRVDRALRALPDIVKQFPSTVLLVVGDGPEKDPLMALSRELGVWEHVRFEGAVERSRLPLYYSAADIFLSFYDWSNVGNPLLEAMMAGRPVVTIRSGDTERIVSNWSNGVILEEYTPVAAASAIGRLLADPKLRETLGSNALAYARETFLSWDERIEKEIKEVEQLVAKRGARSTRCEEARSGEAPNAPR